MDVAIIFAAFAGVVAAVLTSPFEFIKTRMQLENQLAEMKADDKYVYKSKSALKSIKQIRKTEGLRAFRAGMAPVCAISGITFAFRLSSYNYAFANNLISTEQGVTLLHHAIFFCGCTGVISQLLCNPFNLVKTRIQNIPYVDSPNRTLNVSNRSIVKHIYRTIGISGFFIGADACIPRGFVSATSQLYAYYAIKDKLANSNIFYLTYMEKCGISAAVGGMISSVMISPFDLVLTRIHNQPIYPSGRGMLYRNWYDCAGKIYQNEGIRGFYRGFGMFYIRVGPQTALSLLFWDVFREQYLTYYKNDILKKMYIII